MHFGHRLQYEIALLAALERHPIFAQCLGVVGLAAKRETEVVSGELAFTGHLQLFLCGDLVTVGADGALLILKEQLRNVRLERPTIGSHLLVMGGRVRLEQVFVNLLQNASEALAGRADPTITIRTTLADGLVWVRIQDNGPGIAPDIAARLFTPFATSRSNGLGLGLVIASDIITDLGGSLRWLPDEGGACFELELRRA